MIYDVRLKCGVYYFEIPKIQETPFENIQQLTTSVRLSRGISFCGRSVGYIAVQGAQSGTQRENKREKDKPSAY